MEDGRSGSISSSENPAPGQRMMMKGPEGQNRKLSGRVASSRLSSSMCSASEVGAGFVREASGSLGDRSSRVVSSHRRRRERGSQRRPRGARHPFRQLTLSHRVESSPDSLHRMRHMLWTSINSLCCRSSAAGTTLSLWEDEVAVHHRGVVLTAEDWQQSEFIEVQGLTVAERLNVTQGR